MGALLEEGVAVGKGGPGRRGCQDVGLPKLP